MIWQYQQTTDQIKTIWRKAMQAREEIDDDKTIRRNVHRLSIELWAGVCYTII